MTKPAAKRFQPPAIDKLPEDIRTRILAVQEKSGFVPNVFLTLAYRPDEFRAFFAYHDALMEKDGGLTKAEREMIVVATSAANQCHYCVIAHGAILRIRAKSPQIADQIAVNYRKADITPRQRAMLDFAMKVSQEANTVSEADFAEMAGHGFSRRRHLGHHGDRGVLCAVEPAGQRHRDAAERRVLHDGPAAEAGLSRIAGARFQALRDGMAVPRPATFHVGSAVGVLRMAQDFSPDERSEKPAAHYFGR